MGPWHRAWRHEPASKAILLGSPVWHRRYGGDPCIVDQRILVIGVAALAASWLPARRASSTSPLDALRFE